jgi:hypothetical protein
MPEGDDGEDGGGETKGDKGGEGGKGGKGGRGGRGGVDVLLTHMPPHGVGDMENNGDHNGCPHLLQWVGRHGPQVNRFIDRL